MGGGSHELSVFMFYPVRPPTWQGCSTMAYIIQKYGLNSKINFPATIIACTNKILRSATAALVAAAFSLMLPGIGAAGGGPEQGKTAPMFNLPARTNSEKGVSIDVAPVGFAFDKPARFSVALNTHSGSLNFDLTENSFLEDDKGNLHKPTGWDGSPPGGHHRSGVLSFPSVGAGAKHIKITIRNVSGVPERVFEWALR